MIKTLRAKSNLGEIVYNVLDNEGALSQIKAQIRASIYSVNFLIFQQE